MNALAGLFVAGVGGVFLFLGVWMARGTARVLRRGVRAKATVVALERGRGVYPVVEFVDQLGATHRVRLSVSGGGEQVGDVTEVAYEASDPTSVVGTSFTQTWLFPCASLLLGGAGVLSGILFGLGVLPLVVR
jgi:hypothetical protein